jgi:hypothetical protein
MAAIFAVIAGLDPAIHLLRKEPYAKMMDPRVKPAGDGSGWRRRRVKSTGPALASLVMGRVP